MEKKNKNIYYLNELSDYKVASDYPDIRGWKVNDRDQRFIGKVDNLLVNKNTERVVYLDVDLDESIIEADHAPFSSASENEGIHEFMNKVGEDHLIIPIGLVTLDKDSKKVHTEHIDYQTFAETKRKTKNRSIDRGYEEAVFGSYNREETRYPEGDEFYERGEFIRRDEEDNR